MSGMFASPKAPVMPAPQPEPVIVDNKDTTQAEEAKKKKRRGMATQFISGNNSLSDVSTTKTTLGA